MAILKMSLSSIVLILAIVIIRRLVFHKLPKKTFLVLWDIALCRLLVPFSIPSRFSIYTIVNVLKNIFMVKATSTNTMTIPDIRLMTNRANATLVGTATVTVLPVIAVWIIGLLVCALFFVITHLRCLREYKTSLPIDNEFVEYWLYEHPIKRNVQIRQFDKIAAPLTYGIFSPVILLPKATDWKNEEKLQYIFTHEFVHIRRFDTLTKLLLASVLCVHWFNPFVWVMYILANRDIELSCDEAVVQTFGETVKSAYALTLIGLEEKKSKLAPLCNNFSKNFIEERMVSIMKMKRTSLAGMMLALALVIGVPTVFATSAVIVTGKTDENNNAQAVTSMFDKETGETMISKDNGKTWMTEEKFEQAYLLPKTEAYLTEEVINLKNGIAPTHNIKNGHIAIYKNGDKNWSLKKRSTVNLEIHIKSCLRDGQTVAIGYINNNIYTNVFTDKIVTDKSLEIIVPEDGEYTFYLIGTSSDTIEVQSISIN